MPPALIVAMLVTVMVPEDGTDKSLIWKVPPTFRLPVTLRSELIDSTKSAPADEAVRLTVLVLTSVIDTPPVCDVLALRVVASVMLPLPELSVKTGVDITEAEVCVMLPLPSAVNVMLLDPDRLPATIKSPLLPVLRSTTAAETVPSTVRLPPVLTLSVVPTFDPDSVTAEAVSTMPAEPEVLTTSAGAELLATATAPEPDSRSSVAPEEMALPEAVSVMLPEPLAVSVTLPVPDNVPVIIMLALFRVARSEVPVETEPETVRSLPEVPRSVPALSVPPRVVLVPEVSVAMPPTVTVPAVASDPVAVSVRSVPTFELVRMTVGATSVTFAEPAVFNTSVGALTLPASRLPEPEDSDSVVPEEISTPEAPVTLPAPPALSVTSPVAARSAPTVMLPLLEVLRAMVLVLIEVFTWISPPAAPVSEPTVRVPPRVIAAPDARSAAPPTVT